MKKRVRVWFLMMFIASLLMSGCGGATEEKAKEATSLEAEKNAEKALRQAAEESLEVVEKQKEVLEKKSIITSLEDIEQLLEAMTLEEKVGQMIQVERASVKLEDFSKYYIGAVLSGGGSSPSTDTTDVTAWRDMIENFQIAASKTPHGIPIIYGIDAIHGNNAVANATIFPHNIGLGAANDVALMKNIGRITAEEMRAIGISWTFAPCMPLAKDPRWGRFYESYGESTEITAQLSSALIEGLQENGVAASAKHYLGDGHTKWGTGMFEKIDRGDVELSEKAIRTEVLPVYKAAIEKGVKTIMVSYSSIDGLKMHANKYWVTDVLKEELGFEGFVISDYEGIHELTGESLYDKVVASTNAGVDMFMEPIIWQEVYNALLEAVANGDIPEERITDATRRILRVKFEMGLFENPIPQIEPTYKIGSEENREVAKEAVRKSLVLLKNNKDILPLKKDAKLYVLGPAADDIAVQCGGWTITWQGGETMPEGTSILDGLKAIGGNNIITDPTRANEADIVVLVIGETPYAEYKGDARTLTLEGVGGLTGNFTAIEEAKTLGKPIVTIMVAGRPRIVTEEIKSWDAFIMAGLPGSEGDAIADVLFGEPYDFTGQLRMNWPKSSESLPVKDAQDILFQENYGLNYKE